MVYLTFCVNKSFLSLSIFSAIFFCILCYILLFMVYLTFCVNKSFLILSIFSAIFFCFQIYLTFCVNKSFLSSSIISAIFFCSWSILPSVWINPSSVYQYSLLYSSVHGLFFLSFSQSDFSYFCFVQVYLPC